MRYLRQSVTDLRSNAKYDPVEIMLSVSNDTPARHRIDVQSPVSTACPEASTISGCGDELWIIAQS